MPQIPLFVSSSSEPEQNGAFDVTFQDPLTIPDGAKNATIHIAHATLPFTEPNITEANNQLVITLPDVTGDHPIRERDEPTGDPQRHVLTVPVGLYDVAGLELAINTAVNHMVEPRAQSFAKRPKATSYVTVAQDGADGADIPAGDIPNWCSLIPDYETNRLKMRLNYRHSAVYFSDERTTMGSMLGFSADIGHTVESVVQHRT